MLFVLLSFHGLIVAVGFMLTHVGLTFVGIAVMLMMGICVVIALVKQYESNLQHPVRSLMMTLNIIALSGAVAIGIPGLCLLRKSLRANLTTAGDSAAPVVVATPKRIS